MAFNLKDDWPIIAIAAVAILGFFLLSGSSSNGSGAAAASSGGISPADAAGLEQQSNSLAATLQGQQLASTAAAQSNLESGIFATIGSVLQNQSAQQQGSLQAQVAEYQAYEQELGSSFGDAINSQTQLGVSGNALTGLLAQLQAQQQLASLQNLLGIPGLNSSTIGSLAALGRK